MYGEAIASLFLIAVALLQREALGTLFHPSVIFPLVWSIVLLMLFIGQPLGFFPIPAEAALLFFMGGAFFSIGGLLGDGLGSTFKRGGGASNLPELNYRKLVKLCIAINIVGVPLWWRAIGHLVGDQNNISLLAYSLRQTTATYKETLGPLVGNYLVIGFIFIPVLMLGVLKSKLRWFTFLIAAAPWIATNLITNGRAALMQLALVLIYFYLVVTKRFRARDFILFGSLIILMLSTGALLVGKGGVSTEEGALALISGIGSSLLEYALQGPVLFGQYMQHPWLIRPTWDALSFPCQILSHFKLCSLPALNQSFLPYDVTRNVGNVYSIYLSTFPKYGATGSAILLFIYGAWASFHHRKMLREGSLVHMLLSGYLFSAILLSPFEDYFLPSLNFLIKAAVVTWLIKALFINSDRPSASVSCASPSELQIGTE